MLLILSPFLCLVSSANKLFVSVMIQQPRLPSSGLLPASDVLIRAKEVSFTCYIVFWLINETD